MADGDWPDSPVPGLTVAGADDEMIEGVLVPWLFEHDEAETRDLVAGLLKQLRYMERQACNRDTEGVA